MRRSGYRAAAVLTSLFIGAYSLAAMQRVTDAGTDADAALAPDIAGLLSVSDFTIQQLEVPDTRGVVETSLVLGGVAHTLELEPHTMRAADFRLLVQGASGQLNSVDPPPPATYRGHVLGMPGSRVSATIFDGHVQALIDTNDGERWVVEPLAELMDGALPLDHVVYRASDSDPIEGFCGVADPDQPPAGGSDNDTRGTGLKICDIAIDSDVNWFNSSQQSVLRAARNIERVMDAVEFVYERDTGITYEITVLVIRTAEPDPYSTRDPGGLLNQFSNYWNSNAEVRGVRKDVAHLFTGRDLNGGVIGVASLSTICSSSRGYGLSQSRFSRNFDARAALSAHEIGHNWSAQHCNGANNCRIMCSGLGGCDGVGLPDFAPVSVNSITNHRNSRGCLDDLSSPPGPPPILDDFEIATINAALWSYREGARINADALNEPSGVNSLNLDSTSANAFGDDNQIRSNVIDLSAATQATRVAYFTEHRGVEAGETLSVFFWTDNFEWELLNQIVSDGVDQDAFESWSHTLPANALHAEFRLRFQVDGDQPDDDWYLDDVSIADESCAEDLTGDGVIDLADLAILLSEFGSSGPGLAGDIDGDEDVDLADLSLLLSKFGGPCS